MAIGLRKVADYGGSQEVSEGIYFERKNCRTRVVLKKNSGVRF
jgi:hypothetical protein